MISYDTEDFVIQTLNILENISVKHCISNMIHTNLKNIYLHNIQITELLSQYMDICQLIVRIHIF